MEPCVPGRELPACLSLCPSRVPGARRRVSRVLCGEPLKAPKDALRAQAGGPARVAQAGTSGKWLGDPITRDQACETHPSCPLESPRIDSF